MQIVRRRTLILHERYEKRHGSTYDLVFLNQDENAELTTDKWKSQGFRPDFTSVENLETLEFKDDGTMVQEYQLFIDGKPARHVSAADWPWTWEFSEDNTRVHELQYAVSDAGLDVIITGIGFYPRLRTRRENATDIHTQRLCYREYNDTTYLYIGGYGLLQRE